MIGARAWPCHRAPRLGPRSYLVQKPFGLFNSYPRIQLAVRLPADIETNPS